MMFGVGWFISSVRRAYIKDCIEDLLTATNDPEINEILKDAINELNKKDSIESCKYNQTSIYNATKESNESTS